MGDAVVVLREDHLVHRVAGLGDLEGSGEDDAVEGHVVTADDAVEGSLDVYGGDIVGEQQNLVGVELLGAVSLMEALNSVRSTCSTLCMMKSTISTGV